MGETDLKLRRSIQVLARETPAPLRRFVKRYFVPNSLLRYLYPAPPPTKRKSKRRSFDATSPLAYPDRAARCSDCLKITFRSIRPTDFFDDAFAYWTTARIRGARIRRFFPLEPSAADEKSAAAPAGIIFHVSRCGSTLVSELLKCSRNVIVYSEPHSVDDVLDPPHDWTPEQIIAGLRLLARFFAAHSGGRYIWKLRSVNTLTCDLVLRAFPQTPWIFCIRDPLEVAVSDLENPVYWFRSFAKPDNPFLPFVVNEQHDSISPEVYIARMYAAFCRAIGKVDWTHGRIVKYEDLPDAVWSVVAPHFDLEVGQVERDAMAERALLYSKRHYGKEAAFRADGLQKRQAASEQLRSAVDRYARPALAKLLASCQQQSSASRRQPIERGSL